MIQHHEILFLALTLIVSRASAFHVNIVTNRNTFTSTTTLEEKPSTTNDFSHIDKINVCMGELCKCQEEGNNAESIMEDLQSRNLPFDVEDAPCLGACGVGSMVSIEYMDGDYALLTGLEETLEAIGIITVQEQEIEDSKINNDLSSIVFSEEAKEDIPQFNNEERTDSETNKTPVIINEETTKKTEKNEIKVQVDAIKKVEDEHDAIKRMRAEASQSIHQQSNPWVNMAFYIGKKITDSIAK